MMWVVRRLPPSSAFASLPRHLVTLSSSSSSAAAAGASAQQQHEEEASSSSVRTRSFYSLRTAKRDLPADCRTLMHILFLRDWDPSLELELAQSGLVLTHVLVDHIISCIPSPKLALQFFIWSGERIGYPSATSPASFDVVQWWCHKSNIHTFLSILRTLDRPYLYLSPAKVNVLVQGYGWAGMLDRAFNTLLKTQGFSNVKSVNCFLHAVIKEHKFDMVYKVHLEMERCGASPIVSYKSLIHGLCLAGRLQEADTLLQKMVNMGRFPDVTIYTALIKALSRAGRHDRAFKLLLDMIEQNLAPRVTTSNEVIEGLTYGKQLDRVLTVINDTHKLGCPMDSKTYGSLICGLFDDEGVEEALRFQSSTSTNAFTTEACIYSVLLKGISYVDRAKEALQLFNEMIEKGYSPDACSYSALVKCLCKAQGYKQAYKVLNEIEKVGCYPNRQLFGTLFDAFSSLK